MNTPKLVWYQLHLSTCIVLMVTAGVLVWANLQSYPAAAMVRNDGRWMGFHPHESSTMLGVGWPGCFYIYPKPLKAEFAALFLEEPKTVHGDWDVGHLCGNLMIALIILICTAYVCEWIIRRRERASAP